MTLSRDSLPKILSHPPPLLLLAPFTSMPSLFFVSGTVLKIAHDSGPES